MYITIAIIVFCIWIFLFAGVNYLSQEKFSIEEIFLEILIGFILALLWEPVLFLLIVIGIGFLIALLLNIILTVIHRSKK